MDEQPVKSIETDVLRIAYVEHGPGEGWPVILSHGFPYDIHAYDEVASILARGGSTDHCPVYSRIRSDSLRVRRLLCGMVSKPPAVPMSSSLPTP